MSHETFFWHDNTWNEIHKEQWGAQLLWVYFERWSPTGRAFQMSLVECSSVCRGAQNFFSLLLQSSWEHFNSPERWQVAVKLKHSEPLFWEARMVPIKAAARALFFQYVPGVFICHLSNLTTCEKLSGEHHTQLLKVQQRKSKKFFPKEFYH